jgi:arylsulfatase A-like enzyme
MGIRTPIMVRWPGTVPPLMDEATPVSSIDIVPTIYSLCSIDPVGELPGVNLTDRQAILAREAVYAEAFEHDIADINAPTKSLQYRVAIAWPWKIIEPDTTNLQGAVVELFNLMDDPHEMHNLAEVHPEKVTELRKKLNSWWIPEHLAD